MLRPTTNTSPTSPITQSPRHGHTRQNKSSYLDPPLGLTIFSHVPSTPNRSVHLRSWIRTLHTYSQLHLPLLTYWKIRLSHSYVLAAACNSPQVRVTSQYCTNKCIPARRRTITALSPESRSLRSRNRRNPLPQTAQYSSNHLRRPIYTVSPRTLL